MRLRALLVLFWMTALTGVAYPLLITGIARLAMPFHSGGSILYHKEKPVGSRLIGQKFTQGKYFWGRPSAVDYNPLPSGGSQFSSTSLELKKKVKERESRYAAGESEKLVLAIPSELVFASGSGLDPHISVSGAYYQVDRILKERKWDDKAKNKLIELIEKMTHGRSLGFLGARRVNVLELNMALDELQVVK
jgi:potassium-transporting ATPase KdpC subunit